MAICLASLERDVTTSKQWQGIEAMTRCTVTVKKTKQKNNNLKLGEQLTAINTFIIILVLYNKPA